MQISAFLAASGGSDAGTLAPGSHDIDLSEQLHTLADLYSNGNICLAKAFCHLSNTLNGAAELMEEQQEMLNNKYIKCFEQVKTCQDGAID